MSKTWTIVLLINLSFALPALAQDSVTAFTDVSIIPMDREQVLTHQTVLVRGQQIDAIGPVGEVQIPAGAVKIGGHGKFLLPGLADMHAHMPAHMPVSETERMLLRYLSLGITTVRSMDGTPELLALRDRIAKGQLLGPRIYTAGPVMGDYGTGFPSTPEEAVKSVVEQKAAGYDFVKLYDGLTREIFDSIVAIAERVGMPYVGHVPAKVGLKRVLQTHYASIEHTHWYVPHQDADSAMRTMPTDSTTLAEATEAIKRAGMWVCPTIQVQLSWAGQMGGVSSDPAAYFHVVKTFHDAGIGLLFGLDVFASIDGEMEALKMSGLTPYQVLETATRNVAVFFGTLAQTGTVEVGKRADLVLVEGNPLEDFHLLAGTPVEDANATSLAGVMVGGQWLSSQVLQSRLAAMPATP